MSDDIRSILESATQASSEPAPAAAPDPTPASSPTMEAAPTEPVQSMDSESTGEPGSGSSSVTGKVRDAKGRFASKVTTPTEAPGPSTPSGTQPPVAEQTGTEPPAQGEQTVALKAPQSLKPLAREKFAQAPVEIQQEFVRLDKEVRGALQESAEARKFQESYNQRMAPYEAMFRSEGVEPLHALESLARTAYSLRINSPVQRAKLIASLIKTYPTDIQALDAELSGESAQPNQQNPGIDPASIAAQVRQEVMQSIQAQRQQAMSQRFTQEVEKFSQGAEFFEDVREHMGVLMAAAAQSGREMTLQRAYDLACQMDEGIASILKQREAAKLANAQTASTQQSRRAATSLRTSPATQLPSDGPTDIRGAIEAAIKSTSGRAG